MKPNRSMIRRILAWLGLAPAEAYRVTRTELYSPGGTEPTVIWGWACHACTSGRGADRTSNDAHRAAQIHMLTAHGGQEARA